MPKIPDFKWRGPMNLLLVPTSTIHDFKRVYEIVKPYLSHHPENKHVSAETMIANSQWNDGLYIMIQAGGALYYVQRGSALYNAYQGTAGISLNEFYELYDPTYTTKADHFRLALDKLEEKLKI